jgi:hypothetical protein
MVNQQRPTRVRWIQQRISIWKSWSWVTKFPFTIERQWPRWSSTIRRCKWRVTKISKMPCLNDVRSQMASTSVRSLFWGWSLLTLTGSLNWISWRFTTSNAWRSVPNCWFSTCGALWSNLRWRHTHYKCCRIPITTKFQILKLTSPPTSNTTTKLWPTKNCDVRSFSRPKMTLVMMMKLNLHCLRSKLECRCSMANQR